jgi:hypothetical protein
MATTLTPATEATAAEPAQRDVDLSVVKTLPSPPLGLLHLAPERVGQGVELLRALLERLVRLLGQDDELGAGDAVGHDPPEPGLV